MQRIQEEQTEEGGGERVGPSRQCIIGYIGRLRWLHYQPHLTNGMDNLMESRTSRWTPSVMGTCCKSLCPW